MLIDEAFLLKHTLRFRQFDRSDLKVISNFILTVSTQQFSFTAETKEKREMELLTLWHRPYFWIMAELAIHTEPGIRHETSGDVHH